MTPNSSSRRLGLWLVGARGSVATCVAYGLGALREGLIEPTGLGTEAPPLDALDLVPLDNLVLGGHDVTRRALTRTAGELARHGVLRGELLEAGSGLAGEYEARIRPGVLDDADVGFADLDPQAADRSGAPPRERVERLRADWDEFQAETGVDRVVVCNLASTEAWREPRPAWNELGAFERALDAGEAPPASTLYAYAALGSGRPFVNFTPSLGATPAALRALAEREGVPHCGNDGKTGETLLKTVLAPMFAARALRVLSWQGYNMLGNRDGEVLADPLHRRAKLESKDEALRSILDDPDLHTGVGIDYVPSLQDWKTAWDFVHFEGFLGVRMSLQLTWSGSDSALAAPLVLDLARLAELAAARGEAGAMEHTACYFKSPLGGGTHAFHEQVERLLEYARQRS